MARYYNMKTTFLKDLMAGSTGRVRYRTWSVRVGCILSPLSRSLTLSHVGMGYNVFSPPAIEAAKHVWALIGRQFLSHTLHLFPSSSTSSQLVLILLYQRDQHKDYLLASNFLTPSF